MEIRNIFEAHFSVIEDTRCQCDVKHKLTDVLILIVCAVLCNVFRKLAIAMHKNYISQTKSKISMRRNMNRCSMDDNLLIEVIKTFL